MIVSLPSRGLGAAALAVALAVAGCSSDSDVPQTVVSAPDGGTQINTDTGSGGDFPDINTVPNQRPTSTIQDLARAPEGLPAAESGTQYGEALVGGPTSSAAPPPPPPPPEPPQEALEPIPEPGIQTEESDAAPADVASSPGEAYSATAEPIATPEIVEPQPMESVTAPQPVEPVAEAVPAPVVAQGQTIQGTTAQPAVPEIVPESAPMAAPEPAAPVSAPQPAFPPVQPQGDSTAAAGSVQAPTVGAAQQAQLPASAYGASAPEAYGITPPRPVAAPQQAYYPAPATYRAPSGYPPAGYGGAGGTPVYPAAAPVAAPGPGGYGQPYHSGQPIGLIYFGNGSSNLSSADRNVLQQIADMHRAHGGVVNVVGHASMGNGTADYAEHQQANRRISEARASAVARQLMDYGVPASAIRASAAGASQPLYSEAMPNGEAANRRVEVYLTAY